REHAREHRRRDQVIRRRKRRREQPRVRRRLVVVATTNATATTTTTTTGAHRRDKRRHVLDEARKGLAARRGLLVARVQRRRDAQPRRVALDKESPAGRDPARQRGRRRVELRWRHEVKDVCDERRRE